MFHDLKNQNVEYLKTNLFLKEEMSLLQTANFFLGNFKFDGYILCEKNWCIPALDIYPWVDKSDDLDEVEEFFGYVYKNGDVFSKDPYIWYFENEKTLEPIKDILIGSNEFIFFKSKLDLKTVDFSNPLIKLSDFSTYGIRYVEDYDFFSFFISKS